MQLNGANNFTSGTLNFGISNLTNYGQLNISGNATLGGALKAHFINGYAPNPSNTFSLVNYGSESGVFSPLNLPSSAIWQPIYGSAAFMLKVLDIKPALTSSVKSGQFQFQFAGNTNDSYTILATTNLALPLSNWPSSGSPLLLSNNIYQFIDTQGLALPARYYILRSP
jgi:hypothetical protein